MAAVPVGTVRLRAGQRSTDFSRAVLSAAVRAVSATDANDIASEKKWRERYATHFYRMVELSASSEAAALAIAEAGLAEIQNRLEFAFTSDDGASGDWHSVLGSISAGPAPRELQTATVVGTVPMSRKTPSERIAVQYGGQRLTGERLLAQVDKWMNDGQIEPSAAEAIRSVLSHSEWHDLSGRLFVVMGAGAAMGPTEVLLQLGATVVAVDVPSERVWTRLIALASDSPGTLIFPVRDGDDRGNKGGVGDDDAATRHGTRAALAGCDLLGGGHREVARWLVGLHPKMPMCIGAYAYVDGVRFILIAAAMDAVMEYIRCRRDGVSYAYLCTPTDVHIRPQAAYDDAMSRWRARPSSAIACATLFRGRFLRCSEIAPPVDGGPDAGQLHPVDCTVDQQGPNYLLAKRLQHWRAMVARRDGTIVSSNVAPASATVSVMSNRLLAAAYAGTQYFPPIEIFPPETSNAVMTYALIHDLCNTRAASQPATRLANPLLLFTDGAWHGGMWRLPYKLSTVVELSAMLQLWDENVLKTRAATALVLAAAAKLTSKL